MMFLKLTAVVLLLASVLAAKESQPKPATAQLSASQKTPQKAPHGKREASVGFGHMEYVGPSHPGYNYGIPQPSFNVPQYPAHKYFASPYKFSAPQPSYFAPAAQHGYNSFADNSVKYSIGSKELADLLKALHSPSPAISIKAVPSGHGWETPYSYESFAHHYKPTMFKVQEVAPPSYGAPQLNAYLPPNYGAPQHAPAQEPSYASGIKGLRHYASSGNPPVPDLYSGNKYISAIKPIHTPAQVLSPLHTSIHTQKPFKPSTYLGSTNEISDYSHSQPSTSSSAHNAYLAPSLQYLPPSKFQNKITYEQPSKSYLPPASSKPNNGYLPPKPSNTYLPSTPSNSYLPATTSSHSYIPVSSHEDNGKHLQHLQHHHSSEESHESYGYSGAASAPLGSTSKPHQHPWQP